MKHYVTLISTVLILSIITTSSFAAATYLKVGEYFQGGVIFYLDNAKRKGLLVAIRDADYTLSPGCSSKPKNGPYGQCIWWNGKDGLQITGTKSVLYFTGEQNTQVLMIINPESTAYPAAYIAHRYSTPEDPKYAYWYLPSQSELNKLMLTVNNVPSINATIAAHGGQPLPLLGSGDYRYWSSTEGSPSSASTVFFLNGVVTTLAKIYGEFGVRPVRTFEY